MIVTGYKEKSSWNPFASYGPLVSYHNDSENQPQKDILLTDVIARSPNDTPVFIQVAKY